MKNPTFQSVAWDKSVEGEENWVYGNKIGCMETKKIGCMEKDAKNLEKINSAPPARAAYCRVCSSERRDWALAAEASNGVLELERRGERTCKAPQARQGQTQRWLCAVNRLVVEQMQMHRRQQDA